MIDESDVEMVLRLFTMPTVESSQESTGRRLGFDSRHSTGLGRLGEVADHVPTQHALKRRLVVAKIPRKTGLSVIYAALRLLPKLPFLQIPR